MIGFQKEPMRSYERLPTAGGQRASEDGAVSEALRRQSEINDSDTKFEDTDAGKSGVTSNSAVSGADESSRTLQRPTESQPQLPKLDAGFLSYRKEYPTVMAHPSQVALAEKRRPARPSIEVEPATSPTVESPTERKPTAGVSRKAAQGRGSPSALKGLVGSRKQNSPDSPRANDNDGKFTKSKRHSGRTQAARKDSSVSSSEASENGYNSSADESPTDNRVTRLMKNLPKGVDENAAKQIVNEIVVQGDEVHWSDIAGLDIAKEALKETVVYPFLRPDLFSGLREPARGMLLFGPPGTGKTMLARAVATESRSTFFAISASSLTSKFLGESEKLVRALFALARALAPSIIFVDEIDSLLSTRSGSGEHEATRRIKTEFLIQWSDLAKAAAGREQNDKDKGDASRVLVLAATNMPWAIDEAARRRFVRRQYIPLPESHVRARQLDTLLSHQKHGLADDDLEVLVNLTDGKQQLLSMNLDCADAVQVSLALISPHLQKTQLWAHYEVSAKSCCTCLRKTSDLFNFKILRLV